MADTLIEGSADSLMYQKQMSNLGPFWVDESVGVVIFTNSGEDLTARRTTNGGANWAAQQTAEAGTVVAMSAWFDRETPGDTGSLVHVVWGDTSDSEFKYANYNIATGAWSSVVTIQASALATKTFITKTRSGRLISGWRSSTGQGCEESLDGGASWSAIADPWEGTSTDWAMGASCNTGDDNDAAIVFWDSSAGAVSVKVYDETADSWTETSVGGSIAAPGSVLNQWAVATRLSDGHVIFAAWHGVDQASSDLRAWDLNINSVASPGVTALADVITDTAETVCCGVFIDQRSDDIYVCYLQGAAYQATLGAKYKASSDGGSSWGSQQSLSEDADDDLRFISAGAMGTSAGRFQPWWFNDDLNDIFINLNTDIQFAPVTTNLTPATADLEVEGFAPNLTLQVTPVPASLEIEGFAPTVVVGKVFSPATADLEVEGFAPNLTLQVTPAAAEIDVEGFAPDVGIGKLVTPEPAELAVEGFAPEIIVGRTHRSFGIRLNAFEPDGVTPVGIVTHVLTASYGQDVNAIGSWSVSVPADSPQAAYLGDRYRVQVFIGSEGYVFQGIVTKRQTRVTGETKVLEVSGWSTARELVDRDTGQGFELESETLDDAFTAILDVEGNWATGTVDSPSLAVWSRRFDGVKLWQGLVKLADMFGVLFREDSRTRTIDAGAFGDDSGLTFKNWEGPVPQDLATTNPGLVLLNGIDVAIETTDIVTRVEPFGQVQGIQRDRVTLEHATDTTLYTTQTGTRNSLDYYYLVDSAAEALYGRIEASVIVSDVLPLGLDPSTDLVRAANALHGVAATWLNRRKTPLRSYQIRPEGLRHIVGGNDTFKVGQKARVTYQGASKTADGQTVWLDLDEDLWIMGYRRTVTADGRSSWQMRVSNVTREVPDSTTKLAEMYEQFEASLTAPWPMITWGGTPPVGRLSPIGGDLIAADGTRYGWRWWTEFSNDFDNDLIAWNVTRRIPDFSGRWLNHHYASVAERPGADYGYHTNEVVAGSGFPAAASYVMLAGEELESDFSWFQFGGGFTADGSLNLDDGWGFFREDADNWSLWIRRNGVMKKVGGQTVLTQLYGPDALVRSGVSATAWAHVSHPRIRRAFSGRHAITHDSTGTTHNVDMPWFRPNAGDRYIVVAFSQGSVISTPSGWTSLGGANATGIRGTAFYRDSDPGDTVNFATAISERLHAYVLHLRAGTFFGAPVITIDATTTTGQLDPSSRARPDSTYTNSFWWCGGGWVNANDIGAAPSGFTDAIAQTNASNFATTVAYAISASDPVNPGSFSNSPAGSAAQVRFTLGVAGFALGDDVGAITAYGKSTTGELYIGAGEGGGGYDSRASLRILEANALAELVAPISVPADYPVWALAPGGGDVTLLVYSESDI